MSELHYEDIDEFIKNYIEKDRSGRAIMLTSGWGTGKSYYIKNELKDYLEEYGCKCVVVSLYGLTDISEISKAIYVELRTIGFCDNKKSKSEFKETAKVFGKTILNGFISKIGVDFGKLDEELQRVYESIDLSDKLIVLEDVERTDIDLVELMGYVNGLCEGDGYKVMLVANEYDIGKEYYYNENDVKINFKLSTEYAKYKKAKEKTIGDTIKFHCDHKHTINQILPDYGIGVTELKVNEIIEVMDSLGIYNMRSLKYACQKYVEIIGKIEKIKPKYELDDDIEKIIFHGIIAYVQYRDKGRDISFTNNSTIMSETIGYGKKYRIFRFCYDYINNQEFDEKEVRRQIDNYSEYCRRVKRDKNSDIDNDLHIIYNYNCEKEKDVIEAINKIPEKIENGNIKYCDYPELMSYLFDIKYDVKIELDIEKISNLMIDKLEKAENKYEIIKGNIFGLTFVPCARKNEYRKIIDKMERALFGKYELVNKDYPSLFEHMNEDDLKYMVNEIEDKGILSVFDIDELCLSLEKASSKHLYNIYLLLDRTYRNTNTLEINRIRQDKKFLEVIKNKASVLYDGENDDLIRKRNFEKIVNKINSISNSILLTNKSVCVN